jgi:hypothetical protein
MAFAQLTFRESLHDIEACLRSQANLLYAMGIRVKSFYGLSENAVKNQIWVAISTYLMVAILNKTLGIDQSMSRMLQVISINIFSKDPIHQLLMKTHTKDLNIDIFNQLMLEDL